MSMYSRVSNDSESFLRTCVSAIARGCPAPVSALVLRIRPSSFSNAFLTTLSLFSGWHFGVCDWGR